jgi:superfamily II DNA/RNA helicase
MADLGFVPVVRRLLEATPPEGHRLLFPATLDGEVDVLARRFLARRHRPSAAAPSPDPEASVAAAGRDGAADGPGPEAVPGEIRER